MKKLTLNQKKALAEFCGNFAVAWLTVGIIPTFITGQISAEGLRAAISSVLAAGILIIIMLYLTRGRK